MNIDSHKPCFGDHLLITITINLEKVKNVNLYKRDWRNYSKENLTCLLNNVEWCTDFDNVQDLWNDIEMKIVNVADSVAPVTTMINNHVTSQVPALYDSIDTFKFKCKELML